MAASKKRVSKRRVKVVDSSPAKRRIPFVSKSFDETDEREVNTYFEGILKALGIKYRTAEPYTDLPIYKKVERTISDSDLIIGLYVLRYRDEDSKRTLTSTWLIREVAFGKGQGKDFILLVEEGITDIANFEYEKEIIRFSRSDLKSLKAATLSFLEALRSHGLVRA